MGSVFSPSLQVHRINFQNFLLTSTVKTFELLHFPFSPSPLWPPLTPPSVLRPSFLVVPPFLGTPRDRSVAPVSSYDRWGHSQRYRVLSGVLTDRTAVGVDRVCSSSDYRPLGPDPPYELIRSPLSTRGAKTTTTGDVHRRLESVRKSTSALPTTRRSNTENQGPSFSSVRLPHFPKRILPKREQRDNDKLTPSDGRGSWRRTENDRLTMSW